MKKWIEVNGFGELFLEIILVTFDVPLLFVCLDKNHNRYLVLCEDEEEGEYLLAKCSNQMLLQMLNNEIPMDDTFKKALEGKNLLVKYNFQDKLFEYEFFQVKDIQDAMLPDKGAYFELTNHKIKDYIAKLEEENSKSYSFKINMLSGKIQKTSQYDCDDEINEDTIQWDTEAMKKSFYVYYQLSNKMISNIQHIIDTEFEEERYKKESVIKRRKMYAIQM